MSRARRRGLLRLALLVASVIVLVVAISRLGGSGGSKTGSASAGRAAGGAPTARLRATISAVRLPRPLHGETVAPTADGLLMIGGADRSDASTRQVLLLDSRTGRTSPAGTLIQPMHDSAAVTLSQRTMVFGGGASTTLDTVQELTPGAVARQIGRLPDPVSDLSAVEAGGAAYLVGGYDGQTPVASVLRTTDGRGFTRVGRLPTSVRYTTVAAIGDRIYAFGGELAGGADTDAIQEYEISSARTLTAGHLPDPLSHASSVVLNGSIYLLGGRRNGAASDRILRFDPSGNIAVRAGRLPAPVFDAAAGTVSGVGYLVGGIGAAGTSLDSIIVVHP